MESIPEEKHPICSCGAKMLVVKLRGCCYDFNYFSCNECNLDPDDYVSENELHGGGLPGN